MLGVNIDIINIRYSKDDQEWMRQAFVHYLEELSLFNKQCRHLINWFNSPENPLSTWVSHKLIHAFIFKQDGQAFGFALVKEAPLRGVSQGTDYRMAEFYVSKSHRRRGLGRQAAMQIFDMFSGVWETAQHPGNENAVNFWFKTVESYTEGKFEDEAREGQRRQVFQSRKEKQKKRTKRPFLKKILGN